MRKQLIILLSVALIGVTGGFFAAMVLAPNSGPDYDRIQPQGEEPAPDLIGTRRPDFTLGSSDGRQVSAADFDGSVTLINFWATWCKPCREEMPMLSQFQRDQSENGLKVVGIALDDVQRARDFAADLNISYPILVGSTDVMVVGRLYGNRAGLLPYSVLLDRDGIIRWAHLGELDEGELGEQVEGLY
jgi:thiol-disulfide isomerase/thioredoxin